MTPYIVIIFISIGMLFLYGRLWIAARSGKLWGIIGYGSLAVLTLWNAVARPVMEMVGAVVATQFSPQWARFFCGSWGSARMRVSRTRFDRLHRLDQVFDA